MLREFKNFILRGNVVDLAVAVIIGAAFNGVVQALVRDIITPLIAAIGGKPNFAGLYFEVHKSKFMYGDFFNQVVSFIIMAAVVFFFVVQPINKLQLLATRNKKELPTDRKCPECLSSIPKAATRCAFCTSKVTPEKA
jgi:large conductance mechanosensitive channel